MTPPALAHQVDLKMPSLAQKDKVRGVLQPRMAVDAEGIPRRIAIVRPLGYGLEERAVEAVSQWRFTPGVREGSPVPTAMILNLDVEFPAASR